jgi:steroid 5-alpha reductase family enzyme
MVLPARHVRPPCFFGARRGHLAQAPATSPERVADCSCACLPLPSSYTLHFTLHPLLTSSAPRPSSIAEVPAYLLANLSAVQLLALATQLAWSARLTFNGWRRGFFWPTTEDYRWIILRDNWPKGLFGWLAWRLFNAVFIAVIQNVLLLAIALPSYYLLLQSPVANRETTVSFGKSDLAGFQRPASDQPTTAHYVLAGLAFACVLGQYAADGQQQVFQSWKHTPAASRKPTATWRLLGGLGGKLTFDRYDFVRGFISTGLWSYSRQCVALPASPTSCR